MQNCFLYILFFLIVGVILPLQLPSHASSSCVNHSFRRQLLSPASVANFHSFPSSPLQQSYVSCVIASSSPVQQPPGPWLVDGNRIATKIKSASAVINHVEDVVWASNPTRVCPGCCYIINNDDVNQEWPGLPGGVKFDPTDQQIILHLLAKVGVEDYNPHPFISEFIPTVNQEGGICYTHPQKLPGVKRDGSASHFFHRAVKAYTTGTRKRRKVKDDDFGDLRWHKTGRTKPVMLDGVQKGCKKILVLYISTCRGEKPEKTNWVTHQYHLGAEEDEKDGEYVISKIFFQQQVKQTDQSDHECPQSHASTILKVDPVTPKSVTPEPRNERRFYDIDMAHILPEKKNDVVCPQQYVGSVEVPEPEEDRIKGSQITKAVDNMGNEEHQKHDDHIDSSENQQGSQGGEETKWWDGESQYILTSQQLADGLSLCDEFLQSQSPARDGSPGKGKRRPRLSDYARLGPENLKKDLEECQRLVLDPAGIELGTPPEFRLSQLEFGSQDSYIAWGGKHKI